MRIKDLFIKHFGDIILADSSHPDMDTFLTELVELCVKEGRKIKVTSVFEDFVVCPMCDSVFRLTGEEIHFAGIPGYDDELHPVCPACIKKYHFIFNPSVSTHPFQAFRK